MPSPTESADGLKYDGRIALIRSLQSESGIDHRRLVVRLRVLRSVDRRIGVAEENAAFCQAIKIRCDRLRMTPEMPHPIVHVINRDE